QKLIGVIGIQDTPRKEAKSVIVQLKRKGMNLVMLTGDNSNTANAIAGQLGLENVVANVLPSEKADAVKKLQEKGSKIAMVGDGINDAAALAVSDVGIAIGSGTDIALEAGKIVLVRNDLRSLVSAFEISKKTISKIKQNLAYAFLYNVALIPIAGLGLLYPAIAGLAMAASSVSVTGSSLLLKRWKPVMKN
ncbi:MAG: HAD family hydrolase, partial [Nitrososphaeria archaeon]|nr:HAD family hydrolase [Nitrososphaeria archaeon]